MNTTTNPTLAEMQTLDNECGGSPCKVYWDTSDSNNEGWAYRYTDGHGTEQSGELNASYADDELALATEAGNLSKEIGEVVVYDRATERPVLRYNPRTRDYRWVR